MDPGNWATDLAGGSKFGYTLLTVIMISNLMAILLQALAARLGIATGRDLAQACRDAFPRPVNFVLYIACELAIIACDLAEVIGTAIALQLLFNIPLVYGALITAADAFLLLLLMNRGFRFLEAFIIALLVVIAGCFAIQIVAAQPPIAALLAGFIPTPEIVTNPEMLYIAMGIIGATVMPHNLYLHSSIVQTRAYERTESGKRDAIKWATVDSTVALMLALFVNAAILVVAAATFHTSGHADVEEIGQAFQLLSPLLGLGIASTLFRRGAACLGPQFDRHRDARRADRDGRLPAHPPAALGAAPADARHRHRAGRGRHRALRRERHGQAAGAVAGDPVDAAAVRGDPAGQLRHQQAQDGDVRDRHAGGGAGVERCRDHRRPEPEAALRHLRRLSRGVVVRDRPGRDRAEAGQVDALAEIEA